MSKIDLYDPKWIELVFAEKNKNYGAYRLRKSTSKRNIKALVILFVAAALVGGFLAWKVVEQKNAEAQQAYMEAMELQRLQDLAKKERKSRSRLNRRSSPRRSLRKCALHRSSPPLSSRKMSW